MHDISEPLSIIDELRKLGQMWEEPLAKLVRAHGSDLCPNLSKSGGWHVFNDLTVQGLSVARCLMCGKKWDTELLRKKSPFKGSKIDNWVQEANLGAASAVKVTVGFVE